MPLTRSVNLSRNRFQNKTSTNLDPITYNDRYPGLDEYNYKKLESKIDAFGLSGYEREQAMDEAYLQVLPMVQTDIKNSDRRKYINQSEYEVSQITDSTARKVANAKLDVVKLTQRVKEKYHVDPSAPDEEVFNDWIASIPNGEELLDNYMINGDKELLYEGGLEERPIQLGGTKNLINQTSTSDKTWDEKNFGEKVDTVTNYSNVLGLGTEKIDEQATKFADKWLDWGNMIVDSTTNNLKNKLESMTPEEIEKYREQYKKLLEDKNLGEARVRGNNLAEKRWNIIKGNLDYDYSDEGFMKWLADQKSNLWEAETDASGTLLDNETNPNVIQMFGNIPSSTLKTFTATVRGMTNPIDTLKGMYKLAATKEGHQAILDRYGSWDAFANAMNTDPIGVADDILAIAELGTNIARGGLKFTGKLTGNQGLANAANKIPVIGSANDALASKTIGGIYGAMDYAADYTDSNLVKGVNRIVQDESSLSKMVNEGKTAVEGVENSSFGQAIKNAKDEFINKLVGIDESDREFIQNNKDLVNEYMNGDKNVETIYDDIKEKISDKQIANSEMGKEYEALRERGQTANTEALASDMVDKLRKNKITINADGNLEFDKLSKYNASQQKALQDAWDVIKSAQAAGEIDATTILDLRQKMDDKINRTGKPTEVRNMSTVDKATEKLIKEMRGTIDARAKAQIDGLAELDEKYAPALDEMRDIKKDRFDSDGKFRDNSRSKIRNLTKGGNEERLARLEKVAPGIGQDLKALDVAQTIEKATKQGVGQYSKGFLVGSLPAGIANPIAGLASLSLWILTTPKNYVKLVENYPDIVAKLEAGSELLPSDMDRLQALASRIEDGVE